MFWEGDCEAEILEFKTNGKGKKIVKCNDQRKAERGNFVFHHFKEKGNESSPSPAIKVSHLIVSVLHFFLKEN